jgi:hypothetical protein
MKAKMSSEQDSLRIGLVVFVFLWAFSSIGVQLQMNHLEDRLQAQVESVKKSIDQKR